MDCDIHVIYGYQIEKDFLWEQFIVPGCEHVDFTYFQEYCSRCGKLAKKTQTYNTLGFDEFDETLTVYKDPKIYANAPTNLEDYIKYGYAVESDRDLPCVILNVLYTTNEADVFIGVILGGGSIDYADDFIQDVDPEIRDDIDMLILPAPIGPVGYHLIIRCS